MSQPTVMLLTTSSQLGGAEQVVRDIAEDPSSAVTYHAVLPAPGPLVEVLERCGCEVSILPFGRELERASRHQNTRPLLATLRSMRDCAIYLYRLNQLVGQIDPAVIFSHGVKTHILSGIAQFFNRRKLLWYSHLFPPVGALGVLYRLLSKRTSQIIANSHAVGSAVSQITQVNPRVVHCGFDPRRYQAVAPKGRPDQGSDEESLFHFGMITSFAEWKGIDLFLEAFSRLARDHQNLRAVICGDVIARTSYHDNYLDELHNTVADLGIEDRVRFMPFQTNPSPVYSKLDVCIHASKTPEPFGRVVNESRLCGTPIIAANAGGIPEQITDGVDGLLFYPNDTDALTSAMQTVVKDKQLREKLARNGYERARKDFSIGLFRQRITEVVQEALPKTRILHVYSGNLYGGVERALESFAEGHMQVQHDYALFFAGKLYQKLREKQEDVTLIGPARLSQPWSCLRAWLRLQALIRRRTYKRIVFHDTWTYTAVGWFTPAVLWIHTLIKKNSPYHLLLKLRRRLPIIANSEFTRQSLLRLFPHRKLEVVYCPISIAEQASPAGNPREAAIHILTATRLTPLKGLDILLEAAHQLRDLDIMFHIMAIPRSDDERRYLNQLKQTCRRLGLEGSVTFVGDQDQLATLFATCDIYCQPNRKPESFGMGFIEALYRGLPVVTSAMGGASEIIDERCGILVKTSTPDTISQALRNLIENSDLRTGMSRYGKKRAASFINEGRQAEQKILRTA